MIITINGTGAGAGGGGANAANPNPNAANAAATTPSEGICPLLSRLSIRSTAIQQDTIPKLIKVVVARGRKPGDGVSASDEPSEDEETRTSAGDREGEEAEGEPELFRLRRLELKQCGYIGGDVIDWLRERVDRVEYKEGNAPGS